MAKRQQEGKEYLKLVIYHTLDTCNVISIGGIYHNLRCFRLPSDNLCVMETTFHNIQFFMQFAKPLRALFEGRSSSNKRSDKKNWDMFSQENYFPKRINS